MTARVKKGPRLGLVKFVPTADHAARKLLRAEAHPCPWCGTLPQIIKWHTGPQGYGVECVSPSCHVQPSVFTGDGASKTLARWNRRVAARRTAGGRACR